MMRRLRNIAQVSQRGQQQFFVLRNLAFRSEVEFVKLKVGCSQHVRTHDLVSMQL